MAAVTAVLCVAFDEATDAQVMRVRQVVRDAGVALPDRPPHRPHLSMVAAHVERGPELDRLLHVAADVADRHAAFDLVLGTVGRFGRAGALWIGPSTAAPALAGLQADAAAAVTAAGYASAFAERTEPASWVPHCTLATRVAKPELRRVQAALAAAYRPITARVAGVATILVGGRGDVGYAPLG